MSVVATVMVGPGGIPPAIPLLPNVSEALIKVVVDSHVHLPDMFELTFDDEGDILGGNMIDIGCSVMVQATGEDTTLSPLPTTLIIGEVTSIEADVRNAISRTIVRGYEKAHRLQRVRRTFVYRNMKDSDIASMMMLKYGLIPTGPPQIDTTTGVHESIAQFNQTDWEFLKFRAAENGFDFGVINGTMFFRKPPEAGGLPFGFLPLPGGPAKLKGGENLRLFRPRITGASQVPAVMVRSWDPAQKKAVVEKVNATTSQVSIDYGPRPSSLFNKFILPPRMPDIPIPVLVPGTGASIDWSVKEKLPTAVNGDVYAVVDRALAPGEAAAVAKSVAEHLASTSAEAEGMCIGDPKVQAGQTVDVSEVPKYFTGTWVVTNARHVFDASPHVEDYVTEFVVSGRQDRSILGLATLGESNVGAAEPPRVDGVVPAIVVDNNDPKKQGRVRIALPWLADNYVSDWCRCMQMGMGQKGGWMLLPEPDDEVLVAFEFGDVRRPYVIGGLSNPKDSKKYPVPKVAMGKVAERGFMSRDGHKFVFNEDPTPDPTDAVPKAKTGMTIQDKEGKLTINLDMKQPVGKKIEIMVNGASGGSKITMDDMGAIVIESTAPGSGKLTLKAATIEIEAQQQLNVKGAMVNIEGSGPTALKGKPVQIN